MNELDLLLEDTRSLEIVALSADDSSLRTQFLRRISKHVSRRLGRQIHVLDFDLQFSSYMNNLVAIEGIGEDLDNQLLTVQQPSESSIEESVVKLTSCPDLRPGGIIILDSINTLQGMIRNPELDPDSVVANHKAAILITILQQTARYYSKSLWITNITRARPKVLDSGVVFWEREPIGGRMMLFKSDILLSLHQMTQNDSQRAGSHDLYVLVNVERVSANQSVSKSLRESYAIEL
jgi:hypothetical protein